MPLGGGTACRCGSRTPDRGSPREERDRVFEPFVRGEGSTGTGLGLAIARAIVDAHGGTIRIGEEPGGGTAVVLELPGRLAMRPPRVLVVDDDPQILRAVRTSLQGHAYEVLTAGNGETALDQLPNADVDLIVLDLDLPASGATR